MPVSLAQPRAVAKNVSPAERSVQRVARPPRPVVAPASAPSTAVVGALARFWEANKLANKLSREAEKAKEALHKAMLAAGVTEVSEIVVLPDEVGGGAARVQAAIAAKDEEFVDVYKLKEVVGDNAFMAIVSATKGSVIEVAGTTVLAQVLATRKGKVALSVKEVK
jgi:hypothetical protein